MKVSTHNRLLWGRQKAAAFGCPRRNEVTTEQQQIVSCQHTLTQGREGEKGSWCVDCGVKVWEVETHECQDCQHYFKTINYTGCRKHLMAVIPTMNVTYSIEKGSCWKGN